MTASLDRALGAVRGRLAFRLESERREVTGAKALWEALSGGEFREGWLELASSVVRISTSGDLKGHRGTPILAAELVTGDRTSSHVRHLAGDRWSVAAIKRVDDPEALGTIRYFRGADGPRLADFGLRYEVFWNLAPDPHGLSRLRPSVSRFCGFVSEEEMS